MNTNKVYWLEEVALKKMKSQISVVYNLSLLVNQEHFNVGITRSLGNFLFKNSPGNIQSIRLHLDWTYRPILTI